MAIHHHLRPSISLSIMSKLENNHIVFRIKFGPNNSIDSFMLRSAAAGNVSMPHNYNANGELVAKLGSIVHDQRRASLISRAPASTSC